MDSMNIDKFLHIMKTKNERTYLNLVSKVLMMGNKKPNRTGIDSISLFGEQIEIDLKLGFPLLTTKKIHIKSVIHELLWFISGSTNINYLKDNGVRIWNEWADENGNLGPVYGRQWRAWQTENGEYIDQLFTLIQRIKHNPDCRRLILSSWNVADLDKMALAPCHILAQFYVYDGNLSCKLYQRSADLFLGVPFNIASYSLLTHIIAHICDLKVDRFIHSFGDVHIYENHIAQCSEQLTREIFNPPKLKINTKNKDIDNFKFSDFEFMGYRHHPPIKGKVAI